MKSCIIIALIATDAVLIMVPPIASLLHEQALVKAWTLKPQGEGSIFLPEVITRDYSLGCWSVGTLLLMVSIRAAFLSLKQARNPQTEVTP